MREDDSRVNTFRVMRNDIGMDFGLKKCGVPILKKGKVMKFDGIDLPEGQKKKTVER